jgi:alpha-tubulin suppressor-like RCC1 family protein
VRTNSQEHWQYWHWVNYGMSIGAKTLVDCVNSSISNLEINDGPVKYLQLASISKDVDEGFVYSVANVASLPAAADNTGRLVFVSSVNDYYFSNGQAWSTDVNSSAETQLWAWGFNNVGQLGDNTTTSKRSPVSVIGGFTDWCQISAGCAHTAAVRTNGTLWAWGCNNSGRLGDNTTTNRSSPVPVVSGFIDWCQVSAGCHTAAVRTNGTLWAWGFNNVGQLGDNTITSKLSPVSVIGGFTDWCQVSVGSEHTAALRTNGTLWAWGCGFRGRLGDDMIDNRSSPVSVIGGFTDWCQLSAGHAHTAAVRTNGTLWAWGYNGTGQLGDGTTVIARSSPVSVVGGFTDWCQVSAGRNFTAAVRTNGTLWAWGYNGRGQLGDGASTYRISPVSVIGGFTDWCQVSAGYAHTAALRTNGTLWAWGYNGRGQLGDNTITSTSSPVSVVGGFTNWSQVTAGACHTAAVRLIKGF